MTYGNGWGSIAMDPYVQLSELIEEELESVTHTKQKYDLRYPRQVRELSPEHLWHVARAMVIHRLCAPLDHEEEAVRISRAARILV
ncbi:MAG: hypothetical protein HY914_05255 [Desulfomonile tiedjei]|nr:hypothetical protein [Desulfomonile tiedjei]